MYDGDAVGVAVYRRSLNNPKLAAAIWGKLSQAIVMQNVEELKDVPTRNLPEVARKLRVDAEAAFEKEKLTWGK
jgi:hypothetical protein